MKIVISGLLVFGILTVINAGEIIPNSSEDFIAGRKRLKEMRQVKRKSVLERPYGFIRSQTKYSGQLYNPTYYHFDDRPLFNNRRIWEKSDSNYKIASFRKTFELYQLCRLDGFATFAWPGTQRYGQVLKVLYDSAEQMKLNPKEFHIMLEVAPEKSYLEMVPETMKLISDNPYSFRVNGKSLISSYIIDRYKPEELKAKIAYLQEISGNKIAFLPQIHFLTLTGTDGKKLNGHDIYYIYRIHGTIPASMIELIEKYLRSYLEVCDGIYLGHLSSRPDGTLDRGFCDEVLLPIFKSVLAEPAYNGKKLFAIGIRTGYTSYYGAQSLSRDGTGTLRSCLDSVLEFKPDLFIGAEWDELNEDTGFQPLASKPMSNQRILRYYMSCLKGLEPAPNPGDNLEIPNLIVSQRRVIIPGDLMKIELLHVPDTVEGENYRVHFELTDENDKIVYSGETVEFNTAELKESIFTLPGEQFISSQALRTRLTLEYRHKKQIFYTGLPYTVIRPTVNWDLQYYSTPLRNVLIPENTDISISSDRVSCHFRSPEKLAALEVMQDSLEFYAYDPKDEYMRNDEGRKFYRFDHRYVNNPARIRIKYNLNLSNAPSLKIFEYKDTIEAKAQPVKTVDSFRRQTSNSDRWEHSRFFSVAKADIEQAVLVVDGERINGRHKGEKFTWRVCLKDLEKKAVTSTVFEDGLALMLEVDGRPAIIPMPFDTNEVNFSRKLCFNQPNGIIGIRAISEEGKVFWSAPYALNRRFSDETRPVYVFSESTGKVINLNVSANRVPDIKYEFNSPPDHVLRTSAGREFYAMVGSVQAIATGFQGLEYAYSPFKLYNKDIFKEADKPAPEWVQDNGNWVLRFDGERGNFIMFPNVVFPQRAGYTLTFEIKPEEIKSGQILLAHQAIQRSGLTIGVYNGKFSLVYDHRNLHDSKLPWYSQSRFSTNIPLYKDKWQTVKVTYNGNKLTISANRRQESFDLQGTGIYIQSAHFGGRGQKNKNGEIPFYKGLLRRLEVSHFVSEK